VIDDLEAEVTTRVVEEMEVTSGDFVDAGVRALEAWLTICAAPDVSRIVLVDGPSVIGWKRWREVSRRNMLGLIESALVEATEGGMLVTLPSEALAHILLAAADEAAMYVAMAGDPVAARRDVVAVQRHLLESLLRRPAP